MITNTIQSPLLRVLRLSTSPTKAEQVDALIQELAGSGLLDAQNLECLFSWKYEGKDVRLVQLTSVILIPLLLKTSDGQAQRQLFSFRERVRTILDYTEEEMARQIKIAQLASAQQQQNSITHEVFIKAAAHLHDKLNHSIAARERDIRQIERAIGEQLDQLDITENRLSQRAEELLDQEEALQTRSQQTIAETQTLSLELEKGQVALRSTLEMAAKLLGHQ